MIYPWQQKQFNLLYNAFSQNRLSHAYLLSGISGLGKTDFAREFAGFLLCEKNLLPACGNCHACKKFIAKSHPDFLFIQPEEKSKVIKIDQIRELSEKISRTAHAGGYQVVVVSPADSMPVQAANALLKTLEEPNGKVIIFLIDNQEHLLPATIMSRCQKIVFSADEKNALSWLQNAMPTEKNNKLLLRLSGNAPWKVKKLSDNNYLQLRDQILNHLEAIIVRSANPISPIANWLKQDINLILEIITLLCVDISRLQNKVDSNYILNQDVIDKLSLIAAKISPVQLQQFIDYLNEKKLFLSKGINLNAQLCLESIFIECCSR
ncbi:MAG: DNA polymerase III subunit delta' [Gammaproteobacteria bacterium]|nr:DNA polymerase III subunit delta' [Gammaproteobacteria bacterium]